MPTGNIIWFETDFLEGKKENRYSAKYLPQNKGFFEFEGRRKAEMVLENYHQNFMWTLFEFKKWSPVSSPTQCNVLVEVRDSKHAQSVKTSLESYYKDVLWNATIKETASWTCVRTEYKPSFGPNISKEYCMWVVGFQLSLKTSKISWLPFFAL